MRKWHSYEVIYEKKLPSGETLCKTQEDFFRRRFDNGHSRLKYSDTYLMENLNPRLNILSLGSGECINEMLLEARGYRITCSDIYYPKEAGDLFPNLKFFRHNLVLSHPIENKYDCIILLGVLFVFSKNNCSMILRDLSEMLKPGQTLIFEYGGAENNIFTYINDEIICKFEAYIIAFIQNLRGRKCKAVRTRTVYRSKNHEVMEMAKSAGFILCDFKSCDYITELKKRSLLLRKCHDRIIILIGRFIPYIRIFKFKKI